MGTKASGEGNAETMQQEFLFSVRLCHTAKADGLTPTVFRADREYDVPRLDLDDLVKQTARGIPQAAAAHPTRQRLPHRIGQEADQDVCLDPVFFVMPDRPQNEFVLRDAKCPFGVRQLDVMFPQRFRTRVIQVAT